MPELGGSSTQAGIYYQNSVAALALADLIDLDPLPARERVVEVRVEAPDDVDDIVVRYADDHRQFMNVKLSIKTGTDAWKVMWRNLQAQRLAKGFGGDDRLTIIVGEPSPDSQLLTALCERAASSVDEGEFRGRLTEPQVKALAAIGVAVGSDQDTLELLRITALRHLSEAQIQSDFARRRLGGNFALPATLLAALIGIAGGGARRRALFRAAPLRRKLKLEHSIEITEPMEWGLPSYRAMIEKMARIEIPGTGVFGTANELFVWPRARKYERTQPSDFEDENPSEHDPREQDDVDFSAFPSDLLDRAIVVAGPGYGKSALLSAIAGRLSRGPYIPVLVPLASFGASDASVIELLTNHVSREMDLRADWQRLAEQGLLVLLFDGLDEVPGSARRLLLGRISTFSARYPRSPWILTVRDPSVLIGLSEAQLVELLPLNDMDIGRFVDTMKGYAGDSRTWRFVQRLKLYPDLDRLARIPLFLAMLVATTDLANTQSMTRSDLIETYLKTLFSPAEYKLVPDPEDRTVVLRGIAEALAFERLERQEIGATEREVREIISRFAETPAEAQTLFDRLRANGILRQQSAIRLQFPYPIVQEYLAACHLVDRYPDSLAQRIDDAVQRPWAQVIQFALEQHPDPAPIIRGMLDRPDDAFCTGLRLVGRCVANGALVDQALRREIGDRLVEYWASAPFASRERVGRLLVDGFVDPLLPSLRKAVHHPWLIEHGAGDVVAKAHDVELTLSVLDALINRDRREVMIYHSLRPALDEAGDRALRVIVEKLNPEILPEPELDSVAVVLTNFSSRAVSRDLVLAIASNERLPERVRMRGFVLAGAPLDQRAIALVEAAMFAGDWSKQYIVVELIRYHPDRDGFLGRVLRDPNVAFERKFGLATNIARIFPDAEARRAFALSCINDPKFDAEIALVLQLYEARFGDRVAFEKLIDGMATNPIRYVGSAVSIFGHFPDRELAVRAADLVRDRVRDAQDVVFMASSASTGMLYVLEMDYGFGGVLRSAPPHPGISVWMELLEDWSAQVELLPLDRLRLLTEASQLGSDRARSELEMEVLSLSDLGDQKWSDDKGGDHTLSHAIMEVQRRLPLLPLPLVEGFIRSQRANVAMRGVSAMAVRGDLDALRRLVDLHQLPTEWLLKDSIASAIEALAAKLGLVIRKEGPRYTING